MLICILLRLRILKKAEELLKTKPNDRWSFGRMFVQDLLWRQQLLRHVPMILIVLVFALSGIIGIHVAIAVQVGTILFFSSVGVTCTLYSRRVLQQTGCEAMQKVSKRLMMSSIYFQLA